MIFNEWSRWAYLSEIQSNGSDISSRIPRVLSCCPHMHKSQKIDTYLVTNSYTRISEKSSMIRLGPMRSESAKSSRKWRNGWTECNQPKSRDLKVPTKNDCSRTTTVWKRCGSNKTALLWNVSSDNPVKPWWTRLISSERSKKVDKQLMPKQRLLLSFPRPLRAYHCNRPPHDTVQLW